MKPLNDEARKKATRQFIGMYALSVLLVFLVSFFLFRSPVKIYKSQANEYLDFQNAYSNLIKKTRHTTSEITDLAQVEKVSTISSDRSVDSMVMELKKRIGQAVADLKKDASNKNFALLEEDLGNYLTAFEAVQFYSESLNQLKENNTVPVTQGTGANIAGQLRLEILRLRRDSLALAQENRILSTRQNNPNNNNTAQRTVTEPSRSTGSNNQVVTLTNERNELKTQLLQLQQQLARKDAQIAASADSVTSLRIQLRNSNPNRTELTEQEKSRIIFNTVDQVLNRWPSRRDPLERVCSGIRTTLETIRTSYPDKASIDKKLSELSKLCVVR